MELAEKRVDVTDWPIERFLAEDVASKAERIERSGGRVIAVMRREA